MCGSASGDRLPSRPLRALAECGRAAAATAGDAAPRGHLVRHRGGEAAATVSAPARRRSLPQRLLGRRKAARTPLERWKDSAVSGALLEARAGVAAAAAMSELALEELSALAAIYCEPDACEVLAVSGEGGCVPLQGATDRPAGQCRAGRCPNNMRGAGASAADPPAAVLAGARRRPGPERRRCGPAHGRPSGAAPASPLAFSGSARAGASPPVGTASPFVGPATPVRL